jgi:hypothetical protein
MFLLPLTAVIQKMVYLRQMLANNEVILVYLFHFNIQFRFIA